MANNGVSRSGETPGQLAETKLPPESKLLDIDRLSGAEPELMKAIEEKTGVTPDPDTPIKELIANLSDWAGVEQGKTHIPDDIAGQIQEMAKAQGYAGYEFKGANDQQAHIFDPASLDMAQTYHADPSTTPPMPDPSDAAGTC